MIQKKDIFVALFFASMTLVVTQFISILTNKERNYPGEQTMTYRQCLDLKVNNNANENLSKNKKNKLNNVPNVPITDRTKRPNGLYERRIPASRNLDRKYKADIGAFQKQVEILVYNAANGSECLREQIGSIRKMLPSIKIIIASKKSVPLPKDENIHKVSVKYSATEGKALNKMLSLVKSEFFLYLSEGATVSELKSDSGPGWLLHSLESIPELDFVGGGYLRYNSSLKYAQYEAQCYRTKMCNWVFSQTYEYKYSVGDMMVCEDTSTSFMGRTGSVRKVGGFDETLAAMTTSEFFWRAKKTANVGLRPEVFFHISKTCIVSKLDTDTQSGNLRAFLKKYDLRRMIDSYGKVINYPLGPFKHIAIGTSWPDGKTMPPAMFDGYVYLLHKGDDFFNNQTGMSYSLKYGTVIGAIKMRSLLPWDWRADIDSLYYGIKEKDIFPKVKARFSECDVSLQPSYIRMFHREGAYYELSPSGLKQPLPESMLYVFVNGRDVAAKRDFFAEIRGAYGLTYLQYRAAAASVTTATCKDHKSHHACMHPAIANGWGHWKEFYCGM